MQKRRKASWCEGSSGKRADQGVHFVRAGAPFTHNNKQGAKEIKIQNPYPACVQLNHAMTWSILQSNLCWTTSKVHTQRCSWWTNNWCYRFTVESEQKLPPNSTCRHFAFLLKSLISNMHFCIQAFTDKFGIHITFNRFNRGTMVSTVTHLTTLVTFDLGQCPPIITDSSLSKCDSIIDITLLFLSLFKVMGTTRDNTYFVFPKRSCSNHPNIFQSSFPPQTIQKHKSQELISHGSLNLFGLAAPIVITFSHLSWQDQSPFGFCHLDHVHQPSVMTDNSFILKLLNGNCILNLMNHSPMLMLGFFFSTTKLLNQME